MTVPEIAGAWLPIPAFPAHGLPGELCALNWIYGTPGCIVSDSGTEFTGQAILKWVYENTVPWHHIDL